MSESEKHIELVDKVYLYVKDLVPPGCSCLVLADLPSSKEKPNGNIDGYIPDVQYYYKNLFVIGEAKTSNDLETKHSINQIDSYLIECSVFSGDSLLVLGVPFVDACRAQGLIQSEMRKLGVDVTYHIVSEL